MKSKFIKTVVLALIAIVGISVSINIPTFADDVCQSSASQTVKNAAGCNGGGDKLPIVVKNILIAIIGVSGLIAVIFIIIGGVQYMSSSGDPAKTKKAKDTILYACIGLAICALSFAIVNFTIDNIIKYNPEAYLPNSTENHIAFLYK